MIAFYSDGDHIGSAMTESDGRAVLKVSPPYRGRRHIFAAVFDGDAIYRATSATAGT